MDAVKLLSGLLGNKSLSSGMGQKLLGSILGGGGGSQQQGGGGLGGLLGGILGGGNQPLGGQGQPSAQSGAASQGGGISDLLGSVLGGSGGGASTQGAAGGGLAGILGSVLGGGGATATKEAIPQEHRQTANDNAEIMIRAMVNAAKSDGRIDQTEQDNIVSKLGDEVSQDEIAFLKREFAAPLDVAAFARSVPAGLEQQVYFLSLTSIDLDTQNEAQYLGNLAQAMNLSTDVCNQMHDQAGAPRIFG